MIKKPYLVAILTIAGASLLAAIALTTGSNSSGIHSRKALYYVDPMNPTHTSDKPGLAPCGMRMEPVYADLQLPGSSSLPVPSRRGFQVTPEKQQLIGLTTVQVGERVLQRVIRQTGRVVVDETRLYRINATVNGWITSVPALSSGMPIKKDQVLATYNSPQFQSAAQSLVYAVNVRARNQKARPEDGTEPAMDYSTHSINVQQFTESLKNLGMEDRQIEELVKTRKLMRDIEVVAPADGFILSRDVSLGQRFERGAEFYRVADLSHVWILADVPEDEAEYLTPGSRVEVTIPRLHKKREAIVSSALSAVNPASRVLQVRLEADNQDLLLKPEMFVDLAFQISVPDCLTIPADAVVNSGLGEIVFLDLGGGWFESRQVDIGARGGGDVQVLGGLKAGDRVVVSGNFLLDSESRIRMATAGQPSMALDPVCGMQVQKDSAQHQTETGGAKFFFCSEHCKARFSQSPSEFLKSTKTAETALAGSSRAQ